MKLAIILLVLHFIADQLLQIPHVKETKHKSTISLMLHVTTWAFTIAAFTMLVILKTHQVSAISWFISVTIIHFLIEWASIRLWTHYYYVKNKTAMSLCIILEQLIINVSIIAMFDFFVAN